MSRAFPNETSASDGRVSHTLSATVEEWLAPALPEEDLRLPHPILSAQADPRSFLESHRDDVVIALDWPVILEAAELTRLGRHRDLLELDRDYPVRRAGQWTEASFRVGRRQLSRLTVCRDLRVVQRYLAAVEDGQAHAWNPIVFGVALAAFNLPYRSGLLHYASTLLRGFAERCRPRNVPLADWTVWMDSLEAPLPEAAHRLLPSAFTALGAPSRAVGS